MTFNYFDNVKAFAYMAKDGQAFHFCSTTKDCLDGVHFFGENEIEAICFSCMQAGRLIDLDIFTNEVDSSSLDLNLLDVDKVSKEIAYCTPSVPTWQDLYWPIKNGRPYKFIKIASKLDYESKQQFIGSLMDKEVDSEWLWDMLPDHEINNMDEGQYDISCYLFELEGDKITTWDAN